MMYELRATASGKESVCERVLRLIDAHLGEDLTSARIGAELGYHPVHLNRVVRLRYGESLHALVLRRRLERAAVLLSETDMSVTEIAHAPGFFDCAHFSRLFKRKMGVVPRAYRTRTASVPDDA